MKKPVVSKKSSQSTKSSNEYYWRKGSRFTISPKKAGERLDSLKTKLRRNLSAQDVLKDIQDPNSPLRDKLFFMNNDQKAAEKYRLTVARTMLGSLMFTVKLDGSTKKQELPVFVNVSPAVTEAKYGHVIEAFENKLTREIILKRALNELTSIQNKYAHLKELEKIFIQIEKIRSSLESK